MEQTEVYTLPPLPEKRDGDRNRHARREIIGEIVIILEKIFIFATSNRFSTNNKIQKDSELDKAYK